MNQFPDNVRRKNCGPEAAGQTKASLPAVLDAFPRVTLGAFPSPVRVANLQNGLSFWIKDDGQCSSIYGGNKIRKLEYLLAEVQRKGKTVLVVHGDLESHTVQACSFFGRALGLEVHAVVFPYRGQSPKAQDLARLRGQGVKIHERRNMALTILSAHWMAWRMGGYVVPLGATTPCSTLGYIRAAVELVAQVRAGVLPEPRHIYMPFATGGSVAGLLIGLALSGSETRVVAVQSVESIIANRRRLEALLSSTLRLINAEQKDFTRSLRQLEIIDGTYLGSGYRDVPAKTAAALTAASELGICLEPTFSGKAMAALLDVLPRFGQGQLLFWNTHDQHASLSLPARFPLETL